MSHDEVAIRERVIQHLIQLRNFDNGDGWQKLRPIEELIEEARAVLKFILEG